MLKNRSIFTNLFLQYIIIISVLGVIFFLVSYNILKNNYLETLSSELVSNAIIIEGYIADDLKSNNRSSFSYKIHDISRKLDRRVTVIALDGEVIIDSEESYKLMDNHINRPEVKDALKKGMGRATRYSNTLKLNMLYVAYLSRDNSHNFIIRLSLGLKDINEITADYRTRLIIISAGLIFLTMIFAFFMSVNFIKPITLLTRLSKRVAQGDLNVKVITGKNESSEILNLNKNFNEMTTRLRELFSSLKEEKDEVKSIISSINEGILVIDNEGRIRRTNNSFYQIFKTDALNKYYWEIIREPEIISFLKSFQKGDNRRFKKEIDYEDRVLLCSINYLDSRQGFVVLFYDITDIKRVQSMKRDFISNVSHELRTPLTAIKGFTETLLMDEEDESRLKYLNIIHRHNERLINIVKDLLLLSELENSANSKSPWHSLVIEKIEIAPLLNRVVEIMQEKIAVRKIGIEKKLDENIESFEGDPFKLEQLLINLISNAIKYSEADKLEIITEDSGNNIIIKIKDNGIGIPQKDLDRIFERFYVVDKSRSKKSGGTGLGLSIVKHVAILHQGDVRVESAPGSGTTFIVTLPKVHLR